MIARPSGCASPTLRRFLRLASAGKMPTPQRTMPTPQAKGLSLRVPVRLPTRFSLVTGHKYAAAATSRMRETTVGARLDDLRK